MTFDINGHHETPQELAAELADEPPHPSSSKIESIPITVSDHIKTVQVNAPLLDEIRHPNGYGEEGGDPDELIRSLDPEHVSWMFLVI